MAGKAGARYKSGASLALNGPHRRRMTPRRLRHWTGRLLILGALLLTLQYVLAGCNMVFDDGERAWSPRSVLILTAHPDDEVMFFAPAILALVRAGVSVHGLCLSTGNADALGDVRRNELYASYARLGITGMHGNVTIVDDVDLQDGMQSVWDAQRIIRYIDEQADARGPYDAVLTFDGHGVSQHANHIACHEAAQAMVRARITSPSSSSSPPTKIYALRTFSVTTKFLSLPGALVRHALAYLHDVVSSPAKPRHTPGLLQPGRRLVIAPTTLTFLSTPGEYVQALRAMLQHRSQLVWFRYLYIVLSSYMYSVQLDLIE